MYCGDNFCTGKRIIVLRESFLYWKENSCTVGIISVPEREFLYPGAVLRRLSVIEVPAVAVSYASRWFGLCYCVALLPKKLGRGTPSWVRFGIYFWHAFGWTFATYTAQLYISAKIGISLDPCFCSNPCSWLYMVRDPKVLASFSVLSGAESGTPKKREVAIYIYV